NRQLILYFIKGSKTYFILAILFAAAASLFDLINPRIISFTVDSVIGSKKASLPAFFNGFIQGVGGITYLK
ncbi:MAG TPA: ABC transporter ATP-binding protein, partial [Erysipelotrichaceae bacterium]|nr:ABC transporter ATP-binding protein [Erysipelotrichaceae bacterium]